MNAFRTIASAFDVGQVKNRAEDLASILERLGIEQSAVNEVRYHPEVESEIRRMIGVRRTVYVSGWRPAAGWVCVGGLAFYVLINPILQWITGSQGPDFDTGFLIALLTTLLGTATLRTVDKAKGTSL